MFAAVALGLWLTFSALSDGRMLDNLATLSASGVDGPLSIAKAGVRIVRVAVETAPLLVALAPLSVWVTCRATTFRTTAARRCCPPTLAGGCRRVSCIVSC